MGAMPLASEPTDTFFISCSRARHDLEGAARYVELVRSSIADGDGANLFNIEDGALADADALMSTVVDTISGAVVAGCHSVFDGGGTVHLQGVVTNRKFRRCGFGRAVVANAIVASAGAFCSTEFALTVRELDGVPAAEAFGMYMRFGFQIAGRRRVLISGLCCDRHLRESASGPNKDHFFVVGMVSTPESLEIARRYSSIVVV